MLKKYNASLVLVRRADRLVRDVGQACQTDDVRFSPHRRHDGAPYDLAKSAISVTSAAFLPHAIN